MVVMLCTQSFQDNVAGSTLLQVIDKFALTNHNVSHPVTSDNIGALASER